MTPERRHRLLTATPLGEWVARFAFDPDKHPKDAQGRWATADGRYDPGTDFGDSTERPSHTVGPQHLPAPARERAAAWRVGLTDHERGAVEDYTHNGYRAINRALHRAGGDPSKLTAADGSAGGRRTVREAVGGLLSAAAKVTPHDPPLTCWRVMSLPNERMGGFVRAAEAAARSGHAITMPVFGSATLNPSYALLMSMPSVMWNDRADGDAVSKAPDTKRGVLLEIRSRTGLPVGPSGLGYASENEILQSPLVKYRVAGWSDVRFGSDARRVLRLEEVPPDAPVPVPAPGNRV